MGKKKAGYFQKKNKGLAVPPKGSRGVLVTCEPGRTNQAVQQVLRMLETLSDPIEAPQKELTIEEELEQMKDSNTKSRFVSYVSEVAGNFFIRFTEEQDDPFVILEKLYQLLRETKSNTMKHVVKIFPIMASGFPNADESLPVLQTLIPSLFTAEQALNYEVVIHRKHKGDGQKESHDELNKKIVDMVGQPHKPSYHGADHAVMWMSLGRNLYMSVIPKWKEWCNCNIPKFCAQLVLKTTE